MSINEWLLFFLSYNLLIFVGSQRLFKLAGVDSWKSLIPVYNIVKHLEIINRCRKEVGEDFPISVKLNSADFQKGGFTADESIQVAQMLENASVDIIEISGGTYEQPKLIGVDNLTINPKRSEQRKESTIAREAYFLEYAQDIRSKF